jgi:uncharacterized protein
MHFHIILSEKCNSQCRYCHQKSLEEFDNGLDKKFTFDFTAPTTSQIDIHELKEFISKDENPTIIFYGGEPLLEIEKIKEIIDNVEAEYCMQTNGKLLTKLDKDYLQKFKKILISIDGDKERTDFNRGEGNYDKVLEALNHIKTSNHLCEVVARMTLSFTDNFTDLTKQIKHLFEIGFDSVHWQLDAGFYKSDFDQEAFCRFTEEYNKEVSNLINYWLNEMQKGNILKIYPLVGVFKDILYNTKTKLRCGSGYSNYTITTNGTITCCPIMNCIKDFYVGDIKNSDPKNLKEISVSEPCTTCYYLDLCGGRCLYSNKAKLWPREGENLICKTIKHLINELKSKLPEIKKLIENKTISEQDFDYEKYFGPEIIP